MQGVTDRRFEMAVHGCWRSTRRCTPRWLRPSATPTPRSFFIVLGEVHTACRRPSAVDRASPTLFRALRAVLKATAVSGIVNVNYKVRSDGTPAIFEMNFGRPTGDLVAAPPVIVATFLLEYACRAGACPPCSARLSAPCKEDAIVAAAEHSVFVKEAAVARSKGYSESRFDSYTL